MKHITIAELKKHSGVKSHTIRMWERRYQLLRPVRGKSNYRHYSLAELERFLDIALLTADGNKISHVVQFDTPTVYEKLNTLSEASVGIFTFPPFL